MRFRTLVAATLALHLVAPPVDLARAQRPRTEAARESDIAAGSATLHARVVGRGRPVIVLHGGPDLDYGYLLPDLDRLSDAFRLVYYDQRGRGRSAANVRPEDVTMASDVADLDVVRRRFGLDAPVVLGHSWGAVLALEYALRHPTHVGYLVLMNPAPASASDRDVLRKAYLARLGPAMERQRAIMAGAAYQQGDPDTVTARYRIHFGAALVRPADHERLMTAMHAAFVRQGSAGIVKARAVEERLHHETWDSAGYDLLPKLRALRIPTLVIASEQDFIPIEIAEHVAAAIPGAKLVRIPDCGHFSYMECPADVRRALDGFFGSAGTRRR